MSLSFFTIPVSVYDKTNNKSYDIFNIMLKDKYFKNVRIVLEILNECRNIFTKGVNIRETLLNFYGTIGFHMFNYIFVEDFEQLDVCLGDSVELGLEIGSDVHYFGNTEELCNLEFGLKFGLLVSNIYM